MTSPPTASVAEVARRLKETAIGAVVVQETDGRIAGILSERDVVHALVDFDVDLPNQTVAALMTREVVTCAPSDKVHKIMRWMTEGRIRHLPVIEDGALVGIISIGDIVKHRLEELEEESLRLRDYIANAYAAEPRKGIEAPDQILLVVGRRSILRGRIKQREVVEQRGIEPLTSTLRTSRSPN
jgi:signal-transduction protein with cAMP-binding, CBS, and nucleotidyltransferase domain